MKIMHSIISLGIWLIGTSLCFVFISPSFCDYIARAQITEALSLIAGQKIIIQDFYQQEAKCPTDVMLTSSNFPVRGKYVERVHSIANQEYACYVVVTMKDDAARWIRGKHIMYALTRYSPYQMTCQTDIRQFLVACPNEQ